MTQATDQFERRVIIVGVGLIGGSIAAAVRRRYPECRVVGIGRTAKRLQQAQDNGLLTEWATHVTADLVSERCMVVVCLPVDLIAPTVCEFAEVGGPEMLITDAGSVKSVICESVRASEQAAMRFVGAHPIAGGENGGFEFADAELFQDRVCVVTECGQPGAKAAALARVTEFWKGIGCRVMQMSPEDHDHALALTSHMPHVMAAATAAAVGVEYLPLTGSGFRDATRIAAGDAALWQAILTGNRDHVISAIRAAQHQLSAFQKSLEDHDDKALETLLKSAADCRRQLCDEVQTPGC